MRRKRLDRNERGEAEKRRSKRSGTRGRRERRNRRRKRRRSGGRESKTERGRGNGREQYAWRKHLRLIIDHLSIRSLCSQPTLRNHYMRRVVFSTVKNPPCRGRTVRCFFLDGKCRRHKCFFDLMTRCPTRARSATHTREHLSPSLRSFRVSVDRATGPYVALLIFLRRKRKKRRKRKWERLGSRAANA